MAGNIPGAPNSLPGVDTLIQTQSSGASVPGGTRIAAIIGEGTSSQTLVAAAQGSGLDGLNSTYSSAIGADGRHFALALFPVISNRTTLFKNGIPLVGLEGGTDLTNAQFALQVPNKYDYYLNIATGHIQTQTAHIVNEGGLPYIASGNNVGVGTLGSVKVTDLDAPTENWTISCISVQRNGLGQPILATAKFIAVGSVSGNVLDANGNQVVWTANGQIVTNSIISFSIQETTSVPFREGDNFTVQVKSGILNRNDSLSATYIAAQNINFPQFLSTVSSVETNYGQPQVGTNTLSIGCQLAFANGAPGVMCLQAAPAIPRRTSYEVDPDPINAASTDVNDFVFPFPAGVTPDINSEIHIFVTNPTTNVETQLLPNKYPFYEVGQGGVQPTLSQFIFSSQDMPAGFAYSYTVIQQAESDVSGFDGYITGIGAPSFGQPFVGTGLFDSASIIFDNTYIGKVLTVLDSVNVANSGSYLVTNVLNGQLYVTLLSEFSPEQLLATHFTDFTNYASGVAFELINPTTGLPVSGEAGTDGSIVALVNTGTAYISSAGQVTFNAGMIGQPLKINGTAADNGLYMVIAYNSGGPYPGSLTIAKQITTESPLRFEIIDPLNLGDYLVINNLIVPNGNTLRITYVDSRDAPFYDAGWINALAALETQQIDILVTLPQSTISVIFQNALNHCLTMSSIANKKERVLFMGAINGLTPANLTGAQLAAVEQLGVFEGLPNNDIPTLLAGELSDIANYSVPDAFGNTYRCVYFYPDQIVVGIGGSNVLIDGFYLAAAAAGYLAGVSNVAIPLTNKTLTGFTILQNKQFSTLVLSQLASAGVTTLQPVQGGGNVVWGLTTTQSGFTEEQEISIVFIRDSVAKKLRTGFKGYIGIAEDDNMVETLSARAQALLKSFIAQKLITAFDTLSVVRDSVDPTQWNITVRVQPTYPVNFIFIKVSLGVL